MKIGIVNSAYEAESGCVDYKKMKEHGFDCADYQGLMNLKMPIYTVADDAYERMLTEERKAANNAGITFSQVHAAWPVRDRTPEETEQNLAYMKKAVRGTNFLGSEYLVVHPVMPYGFEKEDNVDEVMQINARFFGALCDYALDYDVKICMENMPFPNLALSHIPNICRFIQDLGRKNLFVCLDTGHVNCCNEDCGEMIRLCGDLLKVLHIHDNNRKNDLHLYPYYGTIDWEGFRQALVDIRYDGCLSLETYAPLKLKGKVREDAQTLLVEIVRALQEGGGR